MSIAINTPNIREIPYVLHTFISYRPTFCALPVLPHSISQQFPEISLLAGDEHITLAQKVQANATYQKAECALGSIKQTTAIATKKEIIKQPQDTAKLF